MSVVYFVRKKLFRTKEGMKKLYYAVQHTFHSRGGVTEDVLAERMSQRSGRSLGDVRGMLADLPHCIAEALEHGESVSIKGLGSFHLAVTSDGFENPADVTPGAVRLSRVYFTADRGLTRKLRRNLEFYCYPPDNNLPEEDKEKE